MYTTILNLLENFMLMGNNLDVDFYNNKFKNQPNIDTNTDSNNSNNNTNIEKKTNNNCINNVNNANNKKIKKNIFIVRQKDTLFWTFYIIKYGLFEYEMNISSNQSFSIEKREKFKYIESIRQNKDLLKLHKIKNLQSLENELANEKIISIKTFMSMCIIENINVYLINDRKLYVNILDETMPINIIFKNKDKPYYCIDFDVSSQKINDYNENYLLLPSFDATIKSVNSYKVDELLDICKKLNISIPEKKITKKELYDLIIKTY